MGVWRAILFSLWFVMCRITLQGQCRLRVRIDYSTSMSEFAVTYNTMQVQIGGCVILCRNNGCLGPVVGNVEPV